jgi:hypothetical protein
MYLLSALNYIPVIIMLNFLKLDVAVESSAFLILVRKVLISMHNISSSSVSCDTRSSKGTWRKCDLNSTNIYFISLIYTNVAAKLLKDHNFLLHMAFCGLLKEVNWGIEKIVVGT